MNCTLVLLLVLTLVLDIWRGRQYRAMLRELEVNTKATLESHESAARLLVVLSQIKHDRPAA
jgi:hypothetical protein